MFAVGVALVSAGVLVHVEMFFAMAPMGYRMHGMMDSDDPAMVAAMVAIVVGLALAGRALLARVADTEAPAAASPPPRMEAARMSRSHYIVLLVSVVALAIDVMKPATIAFVLPGLREEYGISTRTASLLPLVALTGTAVGSFVWGAVADRLGRQPSLLLAGLMFVGTAICGAMPTFGWNLVMCFLMGASAGGFLPVMLTLVTETTPAHLRGFVIVLVAGVGGTLGFVAASGLSSLLIPHFGWRVMWLVGLPTGLLLIGLRRWMPESHRFLRLTGRFDEADRVARRFGLVAVSAGARAAASAPVAGADRLLRSSYRGLTVALGLYALSWGLVNYGFFTWLPEMLPRARGANGEAIEATGLIAQAAIIALPGSAVVAVLYYFWSAKRTLVATAALSAAALAGVGALSQLPGTSAGVSASLVLLIVAVNGMNALVLPYASELFPTELRARGTGIVAGAGKAGGVMGTLVVSGLVGLATGVGVAALVLVIPLLLATAGVLLKGMDTRGRPLLDRADEAASA